MKHHGMNDSTTPLWLQVPEPSDLVKAFGSAVDVPAFGGRRRTIHLTSTHADSTLIQRALDTVAAFFRWLGSTAGQLDEKTRWTIVVRCAFRRILLPDPALNPLYALK